ncbi:hypothetical protein [Jeotgalibacillus haloalkalitolerans]|uniref:Uncharacterized protein n=1 Tax=Jeotgalibacillus haloalkalitolerans TaxID=3104292 RepID=A0ABU5KMP6_9BACL|nr:hypothetical protein [Jeotgalibacillus sp. HH7-29]MDZ5712527.1 hypothetical protein [Jeotgalibacillus sp. HH7-29]
MKKVFRLGISVLVLSMGLLIPSTAIGNTIEPLGAGEWDILGTRSMTLGNGTVTIYDSSLWSGGGDYRLVISDADPSNVISVIVTEMDGDSSSLVYGVTRNGNGNGEYRFSTRGFTDFSNGKAELKFKISGSLQPFDNITVSFQD